MVEITLQLPDQLARQVLPVQDQLPEIIELGLRQWRKRNLAPVSPRERVEQIWEAKGLIEPANASDSIHPVQRRTPIRAGGQTASEIIIEQRGAL